MLLTGRGYCLMGTEETRDISTLGSVGWGCGRQNGSFGEDQGLSPGVN